MGPKKPPRSNRPKDNAFDHTKNSPSSKKPSHANISPTAVLRSIVTSLPIELQQTILNVFANAFPLAGNDADLKSTTQEVKGHLYNRDFARAFGKQEYLTAYVLRWSPARALAYADILAKFDAEHQWSRRSYNSAEGHNTIKVTCIGGGAGAEVVALAALSRHKDFPDMRITAVDVADWLECMQALQLSVVSPPPLSKYASESMKAANKPLIDASQWRVLFTRADVLHYTEPEVIELLEPVDLVTVMFTLNELFTASVSKTTSLFLRLTDAMRPGSYLLVVDSPGSYSDIQFAKDAESKKYPMKWLLDHTLLDIVGKEADGSYKWMKLIDEESRWFRRSTTLKYPTGLEDMRYQIHAYQRGRSPGAR